MQFGILFSGQGAQKPGMGLDFLADPTFKAVLDQASFSSELDLVQVLKSEQGELNQTKFVQPALAAVSLGIWQMLKRDLPKLPVNGMIGLSLGEYSALMAAESLSIDEGFALLSDRAKYMQADADRQATAMAAVMDPDIAKVEAICDQVDQAWVANYNSPKQLVVGGTVAAIDEVVAQLTAQQAGKRVIKLNVSGAFHTPLFATAQEKMHERLKTVTFKPTKVPVISNTTTEPFAADQIAAILEEQLASPTHFGACLQTVLTGSQTDAVLELGPGKTLTKFAKQVDKSLARFNIENQSDYENFVKEHQEWI